MNGPHRNNHFFFFKLQKGLLVCPITSFKLFDDFLSFSHPKRSNVIILILRSVFNKKIILTNKKKKLLKCPTTSFKLFNNSEWFSYSKKSNFINFIFISQLFYNVHLTNYRSVLTTNKIKINIIKNYKIEI
jgi:hypothetical protein